MEKDLTVEELAKVFKMVPVEGERNVYIVQAGPLEAPADGEMTEEDWDKFERDINDACEQIP